MLDRAELSFLVWMLLLSATNSPLIHQVFPTLFMCEEKATTTSTSKYYHYRRVDRQELKAIGTDQKHDKQQQKRKNVSLSLSLCKFHESNMKSSLQDWNHIFMLCSFSCGHLFMLFMIWFFFSLLDLKSYMCAIQGRSVYTDFIHVNVTVLHQLFLDQLSSYWVLVCAGLQNPNP